MGFPPTPQTGTASEADPRIGHYRIVRELGRGGQATVYLATDVRDDRQVALKVLDHRSGGDHRAFERFRREADITSRLDHPGICAVYDTGEDQGFRWIAMRYIEGQTIASQLSSARSSGLTAESDFVELSQAEWDVASGRFLRSLMGAAGKPEELSIHPLSEDVIVTGPLTKTWNIARPKPRKVLRAMASASFLGDADHVLCGNAQGDVAVIDVGPASRGSLWTMKERPHSVVAVSLNRRVAAVATRGLAESEIVLYAVKDGAIEERQRLTVKYMLSFMRLSPDGSRLLSFIAEGRTCELTETFASAGSDGAANPEATMIRVDDAGVTQLHDLAWLDNARVVSVATLHAPRGVDASREGLVVWNVDDMEQLAAKEHGSLLDCIVAAPDGHAVAEAGVDKIVRIRDGATLEVTHAFRAHDENVTALAWNPARPILATASADLSVKLWNVETGLCLREIRFMPFAVMALGFSADGRRLLTVSAGVVALWDVD